MFSGVKAAVKQQHVQDKGHSVCIVGIITQPEVHIRLEVLFFEHGNWFLFVPGWSLLASLR